MKLTDKEKELKRKDILSSAREVFSKKSFHEANIEEIADLASISKGTLYIYFDSKEDIFISMIIDEFNRWQKILLEVARKKLPPHEKLKEFIRRELKFHLKNAEFYSIYISHRGSIKDIDEVIEKHKEEFIKQREQLLNIYVEIMTGFIENNFIQAQDPVDLSMILIGMIHGIIFKKMEGKEIDDEEIIIDLIYNIFLNGVKKE